MARWLLGSVGLIAGVGVVLTALGCAHGRPPRLGVTAGRLAPCPSSPNCVSSQADPGDKTHYIAPLALTGPPSGAIDRLAAIVTAMPRTRIVQRSDTYLRAEFRSFVWRFVDDVEFLVDAPDKVVQIRSASRLGHSDFGVNRKRMEAIRKAWTNASQ